MFQLRVDASIGKGKAMGQGEKAEAMGSAPSVPESCRWCMQGKKSSPVPDSIRLIWLCPLLLPWQLREGWVASSGCAMATGLGKGLEVGDPEPQEKRKTCV